MDEQRTTDPVNDRPTGTVRSRGGRATEPDHGDLRHAPDPTPSLARRFPAETRLLAVLVAVIAVFGVGGVAALFGIPWAAFFDLDIELNGAAVFSALLLVAAGGATVGAWWTGAGRGTLVPVGALLIFMSADEYFALHELVEFYTGIDWQVVYLPVFAAAGVCALAALRQHRSNRTFVACWVIASLCWGISQVLEKLEWEGDVKQPGYAFMMVPEELMEMLGSVAFLIGALVLLTVHHRIHGGPSWTMRRPRAR